MLGSTAAEAARRFGERTVLSGPTGRLTYGELDRAADQVAAGLRRRGLEPGQVLATVLPSDAEWLIAAVAADRSRVVLAPVSPALAPPERAALVEKAGADLVLADPDHLDGLSLRRHVVGLERGARCAELAGEASVPSGEPTPEDPERVSTICFTSGTTGRAKGAVFRVRHQRAVQALDLGADPAWGDGSAMLASTQFAHVGMVLKLPWYLRRGMTLHVMGRWRADDALELIAREKMPSVGVVAPQLALMLRSPLMDTLDMSCVQTIVAGGAASPPALVEEARRRFGARYSIRYSSTESGGVGLGTAFDAPDEEALHTIGRPRPGVEARVADEDGTPLPAGEVGELQLRSPAVMDGYWRDPEATADAFAPGRWLRTGDLARVDRSGCFVLAGRRTDMYIRGGYNVFPLEVEAVLGTHPGVHAVAVVPRPDDVLGEIGVAVVVPTDPTAPPKLEDLRAHAAGRLARHKLPEAILVVEELPLTTVSKVDRAAAAALAAQSAPS